MWPATKSLVVRLTREWKLSHNKRSEEAVELHDTAPGEDFRAWPISRGHGVFEQVLCSAALVHESYAPALGRSIALCPHRSRRHVLEAIQGPPVPTENPDRPES